MEYVYHVVTERPMRLGQLIRFDGNHHNGVYNRVKTFFNILNDSSFHNELSDFIKSDMDTWSKVAHREAALEKVRQEKFKNYPSRMACLYTSRNLKEAESWAEFFKEAGRTVYSIVKLQVNGNVFDADACNCFDGTENEAENIEKALHYWNGDIQNEKPVIETLVDGEITVVEIVKEFIK